MDGHHAMDDTNHLPTLSTDPGCEKCYRGRELIDIALGTPVNPTERTYGALWKPCRFCVATPSPAESTQAQPTGLGICTNMVLSAAGASAKSHPIRGEVVSMMVDANPDLGQYDPIMVFLVDHGEGRGSITLACYNMAWTGYFGAMGSTFKPATIREFVKRASLGYLNTKLRGECNRRTKDHEKYLDRVLLTVQAAL